MACAHGDATDHSLAAAYPTALKLQRTEEKSNTPACADSFKRLLDSALLEPGACQLFSGSRVNDRCNPRDAVSRKSPLFSVPTDHLFVRSIVYTIDLVARDVALNPLNLRSQAPQDAAGFLGDALELTGRKLASAGNLAFNDELWHAPVLSTSGQGGERGSPGFYAMHTVLSNGS